MPDTWLISSMSRSSETGFGLFSATPEGLELELSLSPGEALVRRGFDRLKVKLLKSRVWVVVVMFGREG